jgi:transposase
VREKFNCRSCETIAQPPAPFPAIARGFAGPSLLAMMLVEKYANHQPLNRQSEQYAREGIELSVSTMADHVGAGAATLRPLYELIKARPSSTTSIPRPGLPTSWHASTIIRSPTWPHRCRPLPVEPAA